ncbi:MAG: hypothetical protein IJP29_07100 [Lachnospiraceae bacterium]|nr:hypothetical protein [Lachnospiraceae bacterium]
MNKKPKKFKRILMPSSVRQPLRNLLRARHNFKDRLFIKLFHDKNELLSLYNALNGSNYSDPNLLEITTLSDMVYIGIKNDCSFIIGNYLNLYEHQSTINPNMPIRGLNYFSTIYRNYIQTNDLNIYGSVLVKLPTPRYIVFYNGEQELPDKSEIRLSEAFLEKDGCLECIATVININLGHNEDLMKSCNTLLQYAQFVAKVREYYSLGYTHRSAINNAVEYCIEHDILRGFLLKNRNEVNYMFETDYSMKKFWRLQEISYKRDMKPVLKIEMHDEIMDELRPEIKNELRPEIKNELRPEIKNELRIEYEEELRAEAKANIIAELSAQIKSEIQNEIKRATDEKDKEIAWLKKQLAEAQKQT